MDAPTRDEISRLLKRGLNHYGLGEIEQAIACWEKVRELEPDNSAARDYLESAYDELAPRQGEEGTRPAGESSLAPDDPSAPEASSPDAPSEGGENPGDAFVRKGLALYRTGRLEDSLESLQEAARLDPERLDVQGYLELVRGRLTKQYEQEIGDRGRTVKLCVEPEQLVRHELGPEEGFLLSQVDGCLTVEELLSLSTVGRFRTLAILARLLRDGIIE